MIHYLLMCMGCMVFTLLALFLSYLSKHNKNSSLLAWIANLFNDNRNTASEQYNTDGDLMRTNNNMKSSSGNMSQQQNMIGSGFTTSYQ